MRCILFSSWFNFLIATITAEVKWRQEYPLHVEWSHKNLSLVTLSDSQGCKPNAPCSLPNFYSNKYIRSGARSSNSQLGQDRAVLEYLLRKKNGFYVDLAANDYHRFSNTWILDAKHGWHGLCIEPNPQYHIGLLENRRCILVTSPVSSKNDALIDFRFNGVFSGTVATDQYNRPNASVTNDHSMYTVTLATVLQYTNAPAIIDYLSLDVEGGEYNVLENFDFSKYTFLIITVEHPKPKLHRLLVQHKYWFLRVMGWFGDVTYIHESIPNFRNLMMKYAEDRKKHFWAEHMKEPVFI